jgi:septal ring factor EnvC (AmiA/AmiB activator)
LRERAGTLDMRAQSAKAEQQQAEAMHLAADRDSKARAENEALSRQLSEWQTRAQLMEKAVEEARKEMAQLKDELRALAVERDQLRRDLADLQAKSKGPGV